MVKLAMTYGSECWAIKGRYTLKMSGGDENAKIDVWAYVFR